jgi:hypothetical protein
VNALSSSPSTTTKKKNSSPLIYGTLVVDNVDYLYTKYVFWFLLVNHLYKVSCFAYRLYMTLLNFFFKLRNKMIWLTISNIPGQSGIRMSLET